MKKPIITLIAFTVSAVTMAQEPQKKLPKRLKIELTDKEFISIDSVLKVSAERIDSKNATYQLFLPMQPIYRQVQQQLVVDTIKFLPKKQK